MKTPFIQNDPVKRKYELSFHARDNSFEITLERHIVDSFITYDGFRDNVVTERRRERGFKKPWNFGSDGYFGYEDCLRIVPKENGLVALKAAVTKENGLALTATLTELFSMLQYAIDSECPAEGDEEQEMFIRPSLTSGPYGAAMSAELSVAFSLWLYHQDDSLRKTVNEKVNQAMNGLFKVLFDFEPEEESMNGLMEHSFLLAPPAGMYTCQFGILRENQEDLESITTRGHDTFCHNLDYWNQELVLMAGFAKICEAFREGQRTIKET